MIKIQPIRFIKNTCNLFIQFILLSTGYIGPTVSLDSYLFINLLQYPIPTFVSSFVISLSKIMDKKHQVKCKRKITNLIKEPRLVLLSKSTNKKKSRKKMMMLKKTLRTSKNEHIGNFHDIKKQSHQFGIFIRLKLTDTRPSRLLGG